MRRKIFLGYEVGGIRIELLRELFDATFPDSDWSRAYGNLPPDVLNGPKVHEQIREYMDKGCAIIDLTSERRADENRRANNGIGLNALFEMGIATGLKIPIYPILHTTIMNYKELSDRVSDLHGCGLHGYDSRRVLQMNLDAAKAIFLRSVTPSVP